MEYDALNPQPYELHTHDPAAVPTHRASHRDPRDRSSEPRIVIETFDGLHVQTIAVQPGEGPTDAPLARGGWQRVGSWDSADFDRSGVETCRVRAIPDGVLAAWRRHIATLPVVVVR